MLREPGVLDGAGDLVTWYGATWRRGHGEPDRGQYDTPGAVASPCAGAALYRREALEAVGGFDERFFAYLEDADWGLRAQLAGWRCVYVPAAVALHLGGATSRRLGDLETELIARNTLALVVKSFPAGTVGAVVAADRRRIRLWVLVRAARARDVARGAAGVGRGPAPAGWDAACAAGGAAADAGAGGVGRGDEWVRAARLNVKGGWVGMGFGDSSSLSGRCGTAHPRHARAPRGLSAPAANPCAPPR